MQLHHQHPERIKSASDSKGLRLSICVTFLKDFHSNNIQRSILTKMPATEFDSLVPEFSSNHKTLFSFHFNFDSRLDI